MNIVQRLVAAFTFAALLLAATPLLAAPAKKGQSDGTFAGIEQGDYAHFRLKSAKGKEESFFILRPDKSVDSYLKNEAKLKGRKVRVHWEERDEQIPEAGGKQRIKIATRVEERR